MAWVQPDRVEHEAQTLEAMKLAFDLGVDVNAVNADGRTALAGATALKYDAVVEFLAQHGAHAGVPRKTPP